MKALIDYLTLTSKIHSTDFFIDKLGLSGCEFIPITGRYGWQNRIFYRGVSILFGGSREDVCVGLSGTGCRTVEEISNFKFNWLDFLSDFEFDIRTRDVTVARLDIAGDDHLGLLEMETLFTYCKARQYICKARFNIWTDGDEQCVYFGSPSSDRRIRIYNKSLEQKKEGTHWIRCEMQMRNKNAVSFLLNWFNIKDIGDCYSGVLLDFLRFTDRSPEGHSERCEVEPWWIDFIGAIRKQSQLYIDTTVYYNLDSVYNFLQKQSGSSLKLILEANNGDLQDILDIINKSKLNLRQLRLLETIKEKKSEE